MIFLLNDKEGMMKRILNIILLVIPLSVFFHQCNPPKKDTETDPLTHENPVPILTSISPNEKVSHMPPFPLTAIGTDFVTGAHIIFNRNEKPTTFVSSTELTCQIDQDDTSAVIIKRLQALNTHDIFNEIVQVKVRNPSPGGGDSRSIDFTINSNHTFSKSTNISKNSGLSYHPDVATDSSGNVCVVWSDDEQGNSEILFNRSTDGGENWNSLKNISENSGYSSWPAIAIDNTGNINVAWHDTSYTNYEIYFSRSTNHGESWTNPKYLTSDPGRSWEPGIAVSSEGNISLVWSNNLSGNREILYYHSNDGGNKWINYVNITKSPGHSSWPAVSVDGSGNISVVCNDYSSGTRRVNFSYSSNNGASWSDLKDIYINSGMSGYPDVAADVEGNICVVWSYSESNQNKVFFSRSTDRGKNWTDPKDIYPGGDGVYPDITIDIVGNINVVFNKSTQGEREILYTRSIDNGESWIQPLNISNNIGDSEFPAVAVDGQGNVYIVWIDKSAGNSEIFFSASTR